MSDEPDVPQRQKVQRIAYDQSEKVSPGAVVAGLAAANGTAALLMALAKAISRAPGEGTMYTLAAFVIVPLAMGFVSTYLWRHQPLRSATLVGLALLNTLIGLALSYLFLKEGVICLIMAAPVVAMFLVAGTLIGRALFTPKRPPFVQASVIPVLLGTFALDAALPHYHENVIVTRSRPIHASPTQVWPHTISFAPITTPPTYWLFRVGLPCPDRTTADGPFVGATRRCIFTGDLPFTERITEAQPGQRLTFAITGQPDHPELLNHASLRQGQMELVANPDGTTTIIGRSVYRLYVFPSWYFDLWAQSVGHAVHERVFEHIATLAEKSARP